MHRGLRDAYYYMPIEGNYVLLLETIVDANLLPIPPDQTPIMMNSPIQIDDGLPLEYLSEMRQVSVVFINLVVTSSDHESETRNLHRAFNTVYDDMKEFQGK